MIKLQRRAPFKAGDLYRVENFSQLISLSEPGTSPGQEKKRGCGHPVY